MRAVLTAASFSAAVLLFASAAAAQPAAATSRVALPANVWALELPASGSVPSASYTAKLRAAGVNAVIVNATTFSSKRINQVRSGAASAGLIVLVSTKAAKCASLQAPLMCARRVASIPIALRVARAGAAPTIVRVARTGLLQRLKRAHGRIVAIVPYERVIASPAAWKRAISVARSSKMLDLAIGAPKKKIGLTASNPFPGLKPVASVPPPVAPPPATPPSPVVNLRPQLVGANSVVLAWDPPAAGAVDHYEWFANDVLGGTTSLTTAVVTGLTCGTQVAFGVDAVAGDGRHSSRATLSVKPPCPPPGPDTTPPVAAILSGPSAATNATTATFSFVANEPSTFQCSLDGAAYSACSSPISYSILPLGSHRFGVRPTDAASNVGAVVSWSWTITLAAPAPHTTLTDRPANPTTSTSASFSFVSDQAGSTFQCKLDGGAFSFCASPVSYSSLGGGSHTFQVQAIGAGGTFEAVPVAYTWLVTGPPDTTISAKPKTASSSTSAQFSFTSTVPSATFECKLDASVFASCATPKSYSGLSEGAHTFQVRSTTAGGTDATPASYTWTVDITAPTVTVSSGPANPTTATTAVIGFFASELSMFECSLDTGAFAACASPASYSSIAGGAHTFRVRATDAAGNVSAAASYGWTVSVPATAPDTTITAQPSTPTSSTSASFSFTATQSGSTFECRLDAAAFAACSSPKAYTGLADGVHTFQVRATAGGLTDATPASATWTVSSTPQGTVAGNVFMSPSGSDSGVNCQRFAAPVANPGGAVCRTLARAYSLASKGDTVVMAGGTYSGELRRVDAAAKGTAGGGCDRYAGDTAGCVNFVPDSGASVSWAPGVEVHIELPYVHLKGLTIPSGPYGDIYAGVNDTSTNVQGIWLDSVDIPQFFATNMDGFAITDSRVGPCATSSSYSTCDSQIKGGYQASDTPTLEHDILIDNVTFHDTWRTGSQDHIECLLVFDAKNITVRNSAFQNCGIIDFFLASTSGHPLTGALVENTVFDVPGSHSTTSPSNQTTQALLVSCQASTCSNITVRNNSFVSGSQMVTQDPGGSFVGAITYTGNASGGPTVCQSFTTYSYNVFNGSSCGSSSINANPGFASPNTNPVDLHVGTSSPVAGRGNPANAPATDRDGRPRPAPPAAGAYEPR